MILAYKALIILKKNIMAHYKIVLTLLVSKFFNYYIKWDFLTSIEEKNRYNIQYFTLINYGIIKHDFCISRNYTKNLYKMN